MLLGQVWERPLEAVSSRGMPEEEVIKPQDLLG